MSFFGFGSRDSSGARGGSDQYGQSGGDEYDDPQGQQSRGGYGSQMSRGGADGEDDTEGYGNRHPDEDGPQAGNNQSVNLRSWETYAPIVNTALSSVASKYGVDVSNMIPGGGNQAMGQDMQGGRNPSAYGRGSEEEEEEQGYMGGTGRQSQSSAFAGGANNSTGSGGYY